MPEPTTATNNPPLQPTTIAVSFVATSPEDAAKYETYLDRSFIKLKDGKPDPKFKDFFYRVTNVYPQYFGWGNEADVVMRFQVQKYSRTEFVERITGNNKKVKDFRQIPQHTFDRDVGRWVVNDQDAERTIDCAEFDKMFKAE